MPAYRKPIQDFVRNVAMGATAVAHVRRQMERSGHSVVVLERGADTCRIWRDVDLKRLRVPDLLCVRCGRRIEVRAKRDIEISMSHSDADPARAWDAGMRDEDLVAVVACEQFGEMPIDWRVAGPVQFVTIRDLRTAWIQGHVHIPTRKGADQGSELRVVWPTARATAAGTVSEIKTDQINYRRETDGYCLYQKLEKHGIALTSLVCKGQTVRANEIVAAPVPVTSEVSCEPQRGASHYVAILDSPAYQDRYLAVKALGFFADERVADHLLDRLQDHQEHWVVQTQAAASLLKQGHATGAEVLLDKMSSSFDQESLEAVLVAGESESHHAVPLLGSVLRNPKIKAEIRATAAWSLGRMAQPGAVPELIKGMEDAPLQVCEDVARALRLLSANHGGVLRDCLAANSCALPGIAWALAVSEVDIDDLNWNRDDPETEAWSSFVNAMRMQRSKEKGQNASEEALDCGAYTFYTVWRSWVGQLLSADRLANSEDYERELSDSWAALAERRTHE